VMTFRTQSDMSLCGKKCNWGRIHTITTHGFTLLEISVTIVGTPSSSTTLEITRTCPLTPTYPRVYKKFNKSNETSRISFNRSPDYDIGTMNNTQDDYSCVPR